MSGSPYHIPQHILDTGRLSWVLDEEHVYTCPCESWQLHIPHNLAIAFMDRQPTIDERDGIGGSIGPWVLTGVRRLNAAMEDALWEHEAECPVLQHAAVQAGVVRREPFHPYVYSMTRDTR